MLSRSVMSGVINAADEFVLVTDELFLARVHTIHPISDEKYEVWGEAVDFSKETLSEMHGVRWIHIPVNDLSLVDVSMMNSLALA